VHRESKLHPPRLWLFVAEFLERRARTGNSPSVKAPHLGTPKKTPIIELTDTRGGC